MKVNIRIIFIFISINSKFLALGSDNVQLTSDSNKCIRWLNGTPSELSDEEKAQIEKAKAEFNPIEAIKEDPTWNLAANIVAVFSVVVFTFFMGYFA